MSVFVCLYICLSFRTHVSKTLFAKNSLYVRNKGHMVPVLNFWEGTISFGLRRLIRAGLKYW